MTDKPKKSMKRALKIALPALLILVLLSGFTAPGKAFWAAALDFAGLQHFTYRLSADELHIHIINVGKADAMLIESPEARILLDTASETEHDIVLRYLKAREVEALDAVFLSHPDRDHAGGLSALLDVVPAEAVYVGEFVSSAHHTARAGEVYTYGALTLTVLAPSEDFGDTNENSLVLRLDYGDFSMLLCGDIEKNAENALLEGCAALEADVLKVPHHGSDSSSSAAFLAAVQPKAAVISVGRDNNDLPRSAVLKRLYDADAVTYRTDKDGSVVITTDGSRFSILTENGGTEYENHDC